MPDAKDTAILKAMSRALPSRRDAVEATGPTPLERRCQIPGCDQEGAHRAPMSRQRISVYYWFCLDHVRAYNAAWNFYHDMSEAEIEAHIRHDTTWRRPSWRIGSGPRFVYTALRAEFGLFENDDEVTKAEAARGRGRNGGRDGGAVAAGEIQALAMLDLVPPVTFAEIRKRYRKLVKRHHPDANGGDRAAEERLKLINQAYTQLRTVYCR